MKCDRRFKSMIAAAAVGVLCAAAGPLMAADDGAEPKPLALRKIMQDLGKNMQAVTDAISREEWQQVEKIAPLIADHPQPPATEKVRILAFIGTDVGKFRGHDEKAHQAALGMMEAAGRQDGPAVIAAFAAVQNSCLGCHQNYRKPFVEHFYGKR